MLINRRAAAADSMKRLVPIRRMMTRTEQFEAGDLSVPSVAAGNTLRCVE